MAVEVETGDGSFEAFGLQAGIEVDTRNSTLSVKNIQGGAELVNSNGAITLDNIDGALSARRSNRKIPINSAITGACDLSSSTGCYYFCEDVLTPMDKGHSIYEQRKQKIISESTER